MRSSIHSPCFSPISYSAPSLCLNHSGGKGWRCRSALAGRTRLHTLGTGLDGGGGSRPAPARVHYCLSVLDYTPNGTGLDGEGGSRPAPAPILHGRHIFSRRTNQTQEAQVYSRDRPIRHRKRGYILTTDQIYVRVECALAVIGTGGPIKRSKELFVT
eukprot:8480799-Pyramimonas_sp.AAC.2